MRANVDAVTLALVAAHALRAGIGIPCGATLGRVRKAGHTTDALPTGVVSAFVT